MQFAQIDYSTSTPITRFNIQQDAQSVLFTVSYNSRGAGTSANVLADFANALSGAKITLSYIAPHRTTPMLTNIALLDVIEGYGAVKSGLVIANTGTTTVATFHIPLSYDGTLRLGAAPSPYVNIEIDGLVNQLVIGSGTVHANSFFTMDTEVSPVYGKHLAAIDSVNIIAGQTTQFNNASYHALQIPASAGALSKLTMYANSGSSFELTSTTLPAWANKNTKNHLYIDGAIFRYGNWICMDTTKHKTGQISLNSGTICYQHTIKAA